MGFLLIGAAVFALPKLEAVDDIRAFQTLDPQVTATEERLSQLSQAQFASQFFLIDGDDEQEVLEREMEFQRLLQHAQTAGALNGFISVTQLVPPARLQKESLASMASLGPLLDDWVNELGLDGSIAHVFHQNITEADPLTVAHLNDVGAFSDLTTLWIDDVQSLGAIIALKGPLDIEALSTLAMNVDHVTFVDPLKDIETIMSSYRQLVEWLIGLAYLVIFIFLMTKYHWRAALNIIAPPVFAGLSALLFLVWLGQPYTVFATVGLVLIMGIGIDYTLFFKECDGNPDATALAIFMSALSTRALRHKIKLMQMEIRFQVLL